MFIHYFKYCMKNILRTKVVVFWTLLFPIALSTFMYAAFGNINETTEMAKAIPVAVMDSEKDPVFEKVLEQVSTGKDALIKVQDYSEKEAKKALKDGDIYGIFYVSDTITLTVNDNGLKETVLSEFLNQYLQHRNLLTYEDINACKKALHPNGSQDNLISYFFAVLAMCCMFGAYSGVDRLRALQANQSTLGARRGVAPTHKSVVIIAEFLAGLLLQFAIALLAFLYMWKFLGVQFGDRILPIIPILLLGSACGLSFGIFIGALPHPTTENGKIAIATATSMLFSIAADLCAPNVRLTIEHHLPLFNRINPAALICDAFYSLNIYDTYTRYTKNIVLLGVVAIILCTASYLMIRRNRYASL